MRTKDEHRVDFEGKPQYRYKSQFSSVGGDYNIKDDYQFVVPWQMAKTKEKEFEIK